MKTLSVYILCHNRPDFAREAIQSVINQTCQEFSFMVSDNSTTDDVEQMVRSEFPGIVYVRRRPVLKALDHFKLCIDEISTDYFCLFHDDDIMGANFVKEMIECFAKYPQAIAIGCNARIAINDAIQPQTSFRSLRSHEVISTPRNLAKRYFSSCQCGIAPFPGYAYNNLMLGDQRMTNEGGKYADVTWLLNLVRKAPIVWINEPLMTYRMHGNNDGSVETLRDRLSLLRYLKKNLTVFGKDLLSDYRSFVYKKVLAANPVMTSKRHDLLVSFLKLHRYSRYSRVDYWRDIVARAIVRLGTKL